MNVIKWQSWTYKAATKSHNRTAAKQNCASAGNRTRIYCLEGNNANLYTTDAWYKGGKVYHIGSLQAILFLLLQNYSITMETASLIQAQATFGLLL